METVKLVLVTMQQIPRALQVLANISITMKHKTKTCVFYLAKPL